MGCRVSPGGEARAALARRFALRSGRQCACWGAFREYISSIYPNIWLCVLNRSLRVVYSGSGRQSASRMHLLEAWVRVCTTGYEHMVSSYGSTGNDDMVSLYVEYLADALAGGHGQDGGGEAVVGPHAQRPQHLRPPPFNIQHRS